MKKTYISPLCARHAFRAESLMLTDSVKCYNDSENVITTADGAWTRGQGDTPWTDGGSESIWK